MFSEPVVIEVPSYAPLTAMVPVELDDTDRAVAARVAPLFPPGTVLVVAGGEWVIGRSSPPALSRRTLRPGQHQKTKRKPSGVQPRIDCPRTGLPQRPRRKSS